MTILLCFLFGSTASLYAQRVAIRYVKADVEDSGTRKGHSWADAYGNLQEAINELHEYLQNNREYTEGHIYVAAGVYTPTESTESAGGGLQYTAFKLYPGIHIFGGFAADEDNDDVKPYNDDGTVSANRPMLTPDTISATVDRQPWAFQHQTILSGTHGSLSTTFVFDESKGSYATVHPNNSYHVVWFATNDSIATASTGEEGQHYHPLDGTATVDGCVIRGGYASSRNVTRREHASFGGGVYMVGGAVLRRCIVDSCEATLRGGGVYLDGGGEVDMCYIHTCQAGGVGIQQGYGGGVCIDYDGAVKRSYIVNNSARCGGGMAVYRDTTAYPIHALKGASALHSSSTYDAYATSSIVCFNTATAEAGGVYMYDGGSLNHMTIARNECVGLDVTYYGRRYGRTGGLYILNGAMVYNSVIWGNICSTNDDIQYAAYTGGTGNHVPTLYYTAFSKHDITDWTGARKTNVYSLQDANKNTGDDGLHAYFIGRDGAGTISDHVGAGCPPMGSDLDSIPCPASWTPAAISSLTSKGVVARPSIAVDNDMLGYYYDALSTLGALVYEAEPIEHALVSNQETEWYADKDYTSGKVDTYNTALGGDAGTFLNSTLPAQGPSTLPTVFVDPSRKVASLDMGEALGGSWDKPAGQINDAIAYFRQFITDDTGHEGEYKIGGTYYRYVQILIKEGTATTAGKGAFYQNNIRLAAIRPASRMRIYGGYPSSSTGTQTSTRDTHYHPTIISANIANNEYSNNSAHVVSLVDADSVIIDGVRLYYGNGVPNIHGGQADVPYTYGGGVSVSNASSADPQDMTGNILRNAIIANCSAPDGAAIYVNAERSKAELNLVNVIVRNNSVMDGMSGYGNGGVITARGANAKVRLDHCDVVNNCGYPFYTEAVGGTEGQIRVYNSAVYVNDTIDRSNRKNVQQPLFTKGTAGRVKGGYIFIDWDAPVPDGQFHDLHAVFCRDFSDQYRKWGVRKYNTTTQHTVIENGVSPKYFDTESEATAWVAEHSAGAGETWSTPLLMDYPYFVNPSKNVGHSPEGDKPINGGKVDYMPDNMNPMVNAAVEAGLELFDMVHNPCSYGGGPDIGPIEDIHLPAYGTVLYVTPDGAGRRDGSSWGNAIAGNTIYALNGAAAAGTDSKDGDRIINTDGTATVGDNNENGVLTTDSRYCGFAQCFFEDYKDGATRTVTVTNTWTTTTTVYDDGPQEGSSSVTTGPVTTEDSETTSTGATKMGFSPGWGNDPRYPYGEKSGASRFFWRANVSAVPDWWTQNGFGSSNSQEDPYTGETVTGIGNGGYKALLQATDGAGNKLFRVTNNRQEDYVGGLQYAVETAAAQNAVIYAAAIAGKTAEEIAAMETPDYVQVWVGNGTYNDYKGFVMRDKTTVMGGFPTTKYASPGLDERQALMSDGIPKSLTAEKQNLNSTDFETILQISDVNPKQDNGDDPPSLNSDAVKAWDDDLSRTDITETKTYEYKTRTIEYHYSLESDSEQDVTSTYLYDPTFDETSVKNGLNSLSSQTPTDVNGVRYYEFGSASTIKDCWHLSYPIPSSGGLIGNSSFASGGNGWNSVDNTTGSQVATSITNSLWLRDGPLYGVEFWQTMKNVPSGNYRLVVDLGAKYRNHATVTATGVTFRIIGCDGSDLVSQVIVPASNFRRYSFSFTQPQINGEDCEGSLKILIQVTTEKTYSTNDNPSGTSDQDRRDVYMDNLKLFKVIPGTDYVLQSSEDNIANRDVDDPASDVVTTLSEFSVSKHRLTLRKRVLQMPDVTNPVYGGGRLGDYVYKDGSTNKRKNSLVDDNFAHCERINLSTRSSNNDSGRRVLDNDYVGYTDVTWDGFTIRHGFLSEMDMAHGGGAGVCMYEGAHLKNCVIINNYAGSGRNKGAGIFCDGSTATIEGCFVLDNTSSRSCLGKLEDDKQVFAGGMFMYEGMCFNSLFANNYSQGPGGGLGFCVGMFYNNTIAYNTSKFNDGGSINGGAITLATQSNPNLFLANTIIYGNNGKAIRERSDATNVNLVNPFINCYIQSEVELTYDMYVKNITNYADDSNCWGIGNVFFNGEVPSASNTPFAADCWDSDRNEVVDGNGHLVYTGNSLLFDDFRLLSANQGCINYGTEEFGPKMYDALTYKGQSDATIKQTGSIYNLVKDVTLPSTDVAFADRVQDCMVDIGAYEYDGTKEITPGYELINFVPELPDSLELCAVYYVDTVGSGLATANSTSNVACSEKLQKVLDAAGRFRADLDSIRLGRTTGRTFSTDNVTLTGNVTAKYETITISGSDTTWAKEDSTININKTRHVIVKLASGTYHPLRTTDHGSLGQESDIFLDFSLSIPAGVELMGGYSVLGGDTAFAEAYRDVLRQQTIIDGKLTQGKVTGNVYHVLAFDSVLYTTDELILKDRVTDFVIERGVADGLIITGGYANGSDDENKRGGAAVVPYYGHVRNCVLRDNTAIGNGGALYLKPASLVSGSLFLNNSGSYGGAIYAEEPDITGSTTIAQKDTLSARVLNSTIVCNSASTSGGGIYFTTVFRGQGLVLWQNTATENNNVTGVYDSEQLQTAANYPFSYTAVLGQRLPGVNNISVKADPTQGVLWRTDHNDDLRWRGDIVSYTDQANKEAFYYTQKLSSLVRSGMSYSFYQEQQARFPSLEYRDMAGVVRAEEKFSSEAPDHLKSMLLTPQTKNNGFLDIGARALDGDMSPAAQRPFTRVFVAPVEAISPERATKLLESDDPLYSQQGSSMANPFLKFEDALDYIVDQRSRTDKPAGSEETDPTWGQIYADTRFELFVAGGTYYPMHNVRGEEGNARSSTFVLPEGVSLYGGISADSMYCQYGYNFPAYQMVAGGNRLNNNINFAGSDPGNGRSTFYNASGASITIEGITLRDSTSTDDILLQRKKADVNGNSIYEPWEFANITKFSGHTPRGEQSQDNVYHVFTCLADTTDSIIGHLPNRYKNYTGTPYNSLSNVITDDEEAKLTIGGECRESMLKRVIIINGITVQDGNARNYDSEAITNKQQFYRGGGLMIDGSWRNANYDTGQKDADEQGQRNILCIVSNSEFQNNNAIQGGAIFTNGEMQLLSSNFVQNYAKGIVYLASQTDADLDTAKVVTKYCGGGAVAANAMFRCANTLFANNESMLGDFQTSFHDSIWGAHRQGFGGALWGGKQSNLRISNSHFVNNQAVSYPAIYSTSLDTARHRFACNTVFWGQKATGVPADHPDRADFLKLIDTLDINEDVFAYRSQQEKVAELALEALRDTVRAQHKRNPANPTWKAYNSGTDSLQLVKYQSKQGMFFCSYRKRFGPEPEWSPDSIDVASNSYPLLITNGDYVFARGGRYAPKEVPFLGETNIAYYPIFQGNNNINISYVNDDIDGPNFIQPSLSAGVNGYNPAANWAPARINNLTDNGWSYLTLVETEDGVDFAKIGGREPQDVYPDNHVSGGTYNFYSYVMRTMFGLEIMPYGNEYYMHFRDETPTVENQMLRISGSPLLSGASKQAKAYIDIGVYEYQHRELKIAQNSEIDVLWVSEKEDPGKGNDGFTWETPTSNLQAAIETLMKSRNNRAKQINILEGTYTPMSVLGDNKDYSLSFTIQTELYNNGAYTPTTNKDYGVQKLTIRGGYSKEIPDEEGYDFEQHPVVLGVRRLSTSTDDQLNHIVNILDVEQYTTNKTLGEGEGRTAQGTAIPIIFEGITFENNLAGATSTGDDLNTNKGGAAIYYREQKKYVPAESGKGDEQLLPPGTWTQHKEWKDEEDHSKGDTIYYDFSPASSGEHKLVLRNCTFLNNGQQITNPSSAVKIEGGGGSSLIVNSVFHHNAGAPLDAVNTTVLNTTSALNGGHLTLSETIENGTAYHSALHNSVIWRDDQNNATPVTASTPGTQYSGVTIGANMTYNAVTGITAEDDTYKNVGLDDLNQNIFRGPNFADPDNGDFRLNPGLLLVNQGSNATYGTRVWPAYDKDTTIDANTFKQYLLLMENRHPMQDSFRLITARVQDGDEVQEIEYKLYAANPDYDRGFVNRLLFGTIDRGAYECVSQGQRIIYVDPNATVVAKETGRNWNEAYTKGHLQTAIDAASIYIHNNGTKAYVIVKGHNTTGATEGELVLHNGVDVYGSLPPSSRIYAVPYDNTEEVYRYSEAEIEVFLNHLRAERPGMAAKNTRVTQISSVRTLENMPYEKGTTLDGFFISNDVAEVSTPVVQVLNDSISLRNMIISGNRMADGVPALYIRGKNGDPGSMLYNSLLHGNTTVDTPMVVLGTYGFSLNNTIVTANGQKGIGMESGAAVGDNSSNDIVAHADSSIFAPYFSAKNAYTLPDYITGWKLYQYQLHEHSVAINAGTDNGSGANGNNEIAKKFPHTVNFGLDRDILGNPRRLGGRIDNGAFETWRIDRKTYRSATNITNGKTNGHLNLYVTDSLPGSVGYDSGKEGVTFLRKDLTIWTENYGGHHYPHLGSVVYVMDSAKLVFQLNSSSPTFDEETPVRPGYVLVKDGGSIYGQGNKLQMQYVAAEKPFAAGVQYALMSLPFDCYLDSTVRVTNTAGALSQTAKRSTFTPYYYDSYARAAWNYQFQNDRSTLWIPRLDSIMDADGHVKRTEGWLLEFGEPLAAVDTLRFTGWDANGLGYVYEENDDDKVDTLRQYDFRPADGTAHFTHQEDMGWNLRGLPYLVSDYKTGDPAAGDDYQMDIPHLIYQMNSAGTYLKATDQIYTAQSWATSTKVSFGESFFLQSASLDATEDLLFRIPLYTESAPLLAPRPLVLLRDDEGEGDLLQVQPDSTVSAVTYSMGRDGVKWSLSDVPQLYMLAVGDKPLSLVGAAPVEVDLPLGLSIPSPADFTFSIPEPDAYTDYTHVYLIDRQLSHVANLLTSTYTASLDRGKHIGRFFLRIGGVPFGTDKNREYIVYAFDRKLYIRGLVEGDRIAVYSATGQMVVNTVARDAEYTTMLPQAGGIYAVRVNDFSTKVRNL